MAEAARRLGGLTPCPPSGLKLTQHYLQGGRLRQSLRRTVNRVSFSLGRRMVGMAPPPCLRHPHAGGAALLSRPRRPRKTIILRKLTDNKNNSKQTQDRLRPQYNTFSRR